MLLQRKYGFVLGSLLSLFVFRITAQFAQWLHPFEFLPPFQTWHSAVMPYPLLLCCQIVIAAAFLRVIICLYRGNYAPLRRRGCVWLVPSIIYFSVMAFRLVASLTYAEDDSWMCATLPAFFHIILSSFLLIYGFFNYRYGTYGG